MREFLTRIRDALEDIEIPYMVAGSSVSTAYGEPRSTNDIDIIIDPSPRQLDILLPRLKRFCLVQPDFAWQMYDSRSMFNILDMETSLKVDFMFLKNQPFARSELSRRRPAKIQGVLMQALSPEDSILSKLEWSKMAESERQFRDALGVAVVQRERLDEAYLQMWAEELNVTHLLERLWGDATAILEGREDKDKI